jgi:hypothetical protein
MDVVTLVLDGGQWNITGLQEKLRVEAPYVHYVSFKYIPGEPWNIEHKSRAEHSYTLMSPEACDMLIGVDARSNLRHVAVVLSRDSAEHLANRLRDPSCRLIGRLQTLVLQHDPVDD